MIAEEPVRSSDEYWVADDASRPVLLVDQAADAITEALHLVRNGADLDDRDLAAAGVALRDLLGGVGELADLLSSSVAKYAETDPLEVGRIEDRLETLRDTAQHAQRAAEDLEQSSAALQPNADPS